MCAGNLFAGLLECQGQRRDGKGVVLWGKWTSPHKQTNTSGLFLPLIPLPQLQSPGGWGGAQRRKRAFLEQSR